MPIKNLPLLIILISLVFISGCMSSISPVKISDLGDYDGREVWIQGEFVQYHHGYGTYTVKDESGSTVIYSMYSNQSWEAQNEAQNIGDKVKILVHVEKEWFRYKGQYSEHLILTEKERIIITNWTPVPNPSISNIQVLANIYGLSSVPSSGIDEIKFTIGLVPRLPTLDLTKMNIAFSTSTRAPVILTYGSSATTSTFLAQINGEGPPVPSLTEQQQVQISFKVAPVGPNTKITIELKPNVGATLPFTRFVHAPIAAVNFLY